LGQFRCRLSRGKPEMANGNAAQAHYSCTLGHVINNSYRLGQKVPFNEKAGRFGDTRTPTSIS